MDWYNFGQPELNPYLNEVEIWIKRNGLDEKSQAHKLKCFGIGHFKTRILTIKEYRKK